jgi:hypothetical protein
LNHRSPSFEKVDSFLLVVAPSTTSSFELFDSTIRVTFDLECPGARQNIVFLAISWVRNKFPAIKFMFQSIQFNLQREEAMPSIHNFEET